MYRKRNGSLGFSWTKFANAAVPNFFADETPTYTGGLIPYRRDMLYAYQSASPNFHAFDERVFYVAGLAESESMSKKVHKALRKHSILSADNTVDTYAIGPRFVHQIALLNTYRQRELISLLFWWEEESQRYKKLEAEESDLNSLISESETELSNNSEDTIQKEHLDQLRLARERVRMKKRQRPSQRNPNIENDTDDIHLAFHGQSKTAPTISHNRPAGQHAGGSESRTVDARPPEYYASER